MTANSKTSLEYQLDLCKKQSNPSSSPKSIESAAFISANRVDLLRRGLSSFIENSVAFGHSLEFVVFDDSKDAKVRCDYRENLKSVGRDFNANIFYSGLEEKKEFAEFLHQSSGVQRDIINFGLFDPLGIGLTYGANRNAHLLHTVGTVSYCSDDDVICRTFSDRPDPHLLDLSDSYYPLPIWPLESSSEIENWADLPSRDVFGSHEKVIGKDLGTILKEFNRIRASNLKPDFLNNIKSNKGRVLVAVAGSVGDSGDASRRLLLESIRGEARDYLLSSPNLYQRLMASRQVRRIPGNFIITKYSHFHTMSFSVDNREILPPFLPVLRAEDMVFGNMLRHCIPSSQISYVPQAIHHSPFEARTNVDLTDIRGAHVLARLGILDECSGSGGDDPCFEIKEFGRRLREISSLEKIEFKNILMRNLIKAHQTIVLDLSMQLYNYQSMPKFWAHDLEKCISVHNKAISNLEYIPPTGITNIFPDLQKATEVFQVLLKKFGELTEAWPTLIEAAKHLKAKDIRIAKNI